LCHLEIAGTADSLHTGSSMMSLVFMAANRQRLLSFLSLRTIVNENLTYRCHPQFTTYVNVAAYISN
jgi:hypothetical protein